ncbi:MAG: DUF1489 domain-containing protein [Pseudomonadota bacterium]
MGEAPLHLLKLCVGAESVDDLADWQQRYMRQQRAAGQTPRMRHVTRMWPRRAEEILSGGALYWVIKGFIMVRQNILAFDEVRTEDGLRKCAIVLSPELIRTQNAPRRPFQGWRYLQAQDAPPDLRIGDDQSGGLPPRLEIALAELGVGQGGRR